MLVPVVLSGGAGSRLWPVSREGHPKPFMRLSDGQSLLLKTYLRAAGVALSNDRDGELVTVTNRDYYFMSKDELLRARWEIAIVASSCSNRWVEIRPQQLSWPHCMYMSSMVEMR